MKLTADSYFSNLKKWQDELGLLRTIVLDCGLIEEIKWKHPCYTSSGKNIVILHGFKEYCALLFFKGSLLQDTEKLLIQQTVNVEAGRQIRFTNKKEIQKLSPILKAYIFEAIEVEKAGVKIQYKKNTDLVLPEEFLQILNENKSLKKSFAKLTPGRQKGYIYYFSSAKNSQTKINRIEKCIPQIIHGKGFNDCTCGLSKKFPMCDGSHKKMGLESNLLKI